MALTCRLFGHKKVLPISKGLYFRGQFMDVYIGWPGKVHDARVFSNLSLYAKENSGDLFPDWNRNLGCSPGNSR